MYKLIVAFILISLPLGLAKIVAADDICFIGSPSPLTGHPGATFPATAENQPIIDEADAIRGAFDVSAPLYASAHLDDFSDKLGFVYVGQPLVDYLISENGSDPKYNGVGYIVAHEYAHQFQFKVWASGHDLQPKSTAQVELQADVIAGIWYGINDRQFLAALRRQVGPSFDRQIGIDDLVGKEQHAADQVADYLAWTPAAHGTTEQRNAAIKAGIVYGEDFYKSLPDSAFKDHASEIYDVSKDAAKEALND